MPGDLLVSAHSSDASSSADLGGEALCDHGTRKTLCCGRAALIYEAEAKAGIEHMILVSASLLPGLASNAPWSMRE